MCLQLLKEILQVTLTKGSDDKEIRNYIFISSLIHKAETSIFTIFSS